MWRQPYSLQLFSQIDQKTSTLCWLVWILCYVKSSRTRERNWKTGGKLCRRLYTYIKLFILMESWKCVFWKIPIAHIHTSSTCHCPSDGYVFIIPLFLFNSPSFFINKRKGLLPTHTPGLIFYCILNWHTWHKKSCRIQSWLLYPGFLDLIIIYAILLLFHVYNILSELHHPLQRSHFMSKKLK